MLTVRIITPERSLDPVQADHVTLPAFDGEVGVRTGHAAFVTQLGIGAIQLKSGNRANVTYLIKGGVAQVLKDEVKVLAESVSTGADEDRLVKQIIELANKDYEDPLAKAEARAVANWAVAQLKHHGKQVPPEAAKLGL